MTTMVFGVFDGLHDGHRYFLKKSGATIVVIARDLVVRRLKQKTPQQSQQERLSAVQKFLPEATVVLGDEEQGSYDVIKKYKPDRIVLGHDQQELERDLRAKIADGTIPACQLVKTAKLTLS